MLQVKFILLTLILYQSNSSNKKSSDYTFLQKDTCPFNVCKDIVVITPKFGKISNLCSVAAMMVLTTSRVWFLYYDLKYNEALISHEWWSTICTQKDWFIKNKNKYGSFKKFMWKPILIFIVIWMIQIILTTLYFELLILDFSFALIGNSFWCIMLYCFCKMPKHYDVLLIRKEINWITSFYLFSAILLCPYIYTLCF